MLLSFQTSVTHKKLLTSHQTTVSNVKHLSSEITRFFTGFCPMSGANIQVCLFCSSFCIFIKKLFETGFFLKTHEKLHGTLLLSENCPIMDFCLRIVQSWTFENDWCPAKSMVDVTYQFYISLQNYFDNSTLIIL